MRPRPTRPSAATEKLRAGERNGDDRDDRNHDMNCPALYRLLSASIVKKRAPTIQSRVRQGGPSMTTATIRRVCQVTPSTPLRSASGSRSGPPRRALPI